jgi:hypothetical protein
MNTPTNIPLPEPMRSGVAKLERNGFRVVRVAPNGPDPSLGFTAYLSKQLRNGLRLVQVELDASGNVITRQ